MSENHLHMASMCKFNMRSKVEHAHVTKINLEKKMDANITIYFQKLAISCSFSRINIPKISQIITERQADSGHGGF